MLITRISLGRILLTGSLAALPAPAMASPEEDRVARLEEQIKALQTQVEELKKQVTKPLPSWKGAPEFSDKDAGWSFKARGRLHYDTGYVGIPGAYAANRNLGFNSRIRRITIGLEGTIPGGFSYRIEPDFSNANIGFEEISLAYTAPNDRWGARVGNFETLSGLDQMTSSNATSFLERTQIGDGFLNTKRLGAVVGLYEPDDEYRFEAGAFAAHSIDASFDNDGWIGAARAVWAPEIGEGRLHFGLNYQHREFQSNDNGVASNSTGAPSTNQLARYRARPFVHTTDVRFIDTGPFAAKGDDIFGVEAAGVFGPVYFASEAQLMRTRGYRPGDIETGLNAFAGGSAVTPASNPQFWGAYGEIGWFITGESRGYSNNAWARPKVLNPLSKGGAGAFQLMARIDHLDLDDAGLKNALTTNFATGATSLAALNTRLSRGGTQTGFLIGLNWYPIDYLRLMLNYVRVEVEGGPFAAMVKPLSTAPVDERSYSTDAVALRAAVEF